MEVDKRLLCRIYYSLKSRRNRQFNGKKISWTLDLVLQIRTCLNDEKKYDKVANLINQENTIQKNNKFNKND